GGNPSPSPSVTASSASPSPSPSASRSTSPSPSTSPSTSPAAGKACTATYRTVSSWNGGFQGEVTVTNSGSSATAGWSVAMTNPSGQTVSQVWNGTASTSGSVV